MRVYYLLPVGTTEKYTSLSGAGAIPKVQTDLQKYYTEIGITIRPIFSYQWNEESQDSLNARVDVLLSGMVQDDILILSTPTFYNSEGYINTIVERAHTSFKVKVVALTLDLFAFRHETQYAKQHQFGEYFDYWIHREQSLISQCDAVITQSNEMAQAIFDNFKYDKPVIVQGPWGFDTTKVPQPQKQQSSLMFAGSPGKAGYLKELSQHLKHNFNIISAFDQVVPNPEAPDFDPSWTHDAPTNIHIVTRQYDASYVDQMLSGGFGLVWDSLTYPEVTGAFGKYMQLAMPHKFSMYTVAGIPSIVWSKSCLAPLITQKKIGWVIDDLSELDDLIDDVSPEEYQGRVARLDEFSNLIRSGYFSKKAIFNLISALNGDQYERPSADVHLTVGYQ